MPPSPKYTSAHTWQCVNSASDLRGSLGSVLSVSHVIWQKNHSMFSELVVSYARNDITNDSQTMRRSYYLMLQQKIRTFFAAIYAYFGYFLAFVPSTSKTENFPLQITDILICFWYTCKTLEQSIHNAVGIVLYYSTEMT